MHENSELDDNEDTLEGEDVSDETPEVDHVDLLSEDAEAEFLAAVQIDTDAPNKDFLGLPALVWRYGCALSRATAEWLQAKRVYDHVCARLYVAAQAELDGDPTVTAAKVTVKRVEAVMKASPQWLKARANYDRALARKTLAGARLDALTTKQNALQSYAATRRVEARLTNSSTED